VGVSPPCSLPREMEVKVSEILLDRSMIRVVLTSVEITMLLRAATQSVVIKINTNRVIFFIINLIVEFYDAYVVLKKIIN